jgi:hypothetical protein
VCYFLTMKNERRITTGEGGEACTVSRDGTVSAHALHEALTEGVDDSEFCLRTREKLRAKGVPESVLDSVLPITRSSIDNR